MENERLDKNVNTRELLIEYFRYRIPNILKTKNESITEREMEHLINSVANGFERTDLENQLIFDKLSDVRREFHIESILNTSIESYLLIRFKEILKRKLDKNEISKDYYDSYINDDDGVMYNVLSNILDKDTLHRHINNAIDLGISDYFSKDIEDEYIEEEDEYIEDADDYFRD